MVLYHDVIEVSRTGVSHVGNIDTNLAVALSQDDTLNYNYGIDAALAELCVFNSVLNAKTITTYANQTMDNQHPNWSDLQGYWPINEGNGSELADSVQNNHFTVTGSSNWITE